MKPTLVVLAAGMGSRYGGLKQLDGMGPHGETIIDYSIYDAKQAGFGKVVFVIRESFKDAFEAQFGEKIRSIMEVAYAYQEVDAPIEGLDEIPERTKPWGTAHAVLMAKNLVDTPFAVINADDFYGKDAYKKMANFLTEQAEPNHYSMVGYQLQKTLSAHGSVSRGVCKMDENNKLKSVVERTKIYKLNRNIIFRNEAEEHIFIKPTSSVSMNFWGFHTSFFAELENQFITFAKENIHNPKAEFFIPLIVNKMIVDELATVSVLETTDQWFGMTYKEDKEMVQQSIQERINAGAYPEKLWKS